MTDRDDGNRTLRQRAEEQVSEEREAIEHLSPEELKRRIHDLKVYQVELEMQNEALRQAQVDLAASKDRYFDLYHKAPVGHVTIDAEGVVREVNGAMAVMLEQDPHRIRGQHFFRFVGDEYRSDYLGWTKRLLSGESTDLLEVWMKPTDGSELRVQLFGRQISRSGPGRASLPAEIMLTVVNITEKWRWQNELETTSTYLNRAIQVGDMAWWHMNAADGTVHFHRKKTDMLGYRYEDFHGKGYQVFTDLIHPQDHEGTMQAMRDHLEGRTGAYSTEYRIRTADGSYRWFMDFGKTSEKSPDGGPLGITGIVIDVTDRKQARFDLEKSERNYRLLAEHTEDLVCLHEPDGTYEYLSPSVTAMLGYGPEELIGRYPYDFFHPDDIERISRESHLATLETKKINSVTYRFRKRDGEFAWLETYTIPVLDDDGRVTQLVTSSREVSERVEMEETINAERTLLNATLDAIRGGIVVIDTNLRVIQYNRTMAEWAGKPLLGLRCREVFPCCPGDCQNSRTTRVIQEKTALEQTLEYTTAGGEDKVLRVHSYPLIDGDDVKGVVQFADDITEIVSARQELESSEQRWRTVFERSKDGIVLADPETAVFQFANPAWLEITGVEESDLGRISIPDIHPTEDIPDLLEKFAAAREGRIDSIPEVAVKRKDGELRWVELSSYSIVLEGRPQIVGVFRDITERKRTSDALQRSEALSRLVLNSAPDAIFIIDREKMRFIDCNEEACRSLDMTRDELLRIGPHDIKPDYDEARLAAAFDEIISGRTQTGTIQTRHQRRDGSIVPVEIYVGAARYQNQVLMVAAARDITERLEASEALRQSEARYALAQDVSGIGNWEWNIRTNEVFWSDEIYPLFGLQPGDIEVNFDVYRNLIHPDDRQGVMDAIENALESGGNYEVEHRIVLGTGNIRWLFGKGGVVGDADEQAERMVGIVQDITGRKNAESRMQMLSYVVEHSPAIIVVTDTEGTIQYVNTKFTQVTGYSPEEAIGQNPRILKSGTKSTEEYREMWETISSGREWHGEVYNKTRDGRFYWAQVSISSIKDDEGQITHYIGIQEDISSRKEMELDLLRAKEDAEKANQAKSTFLASMSHELRTPLNSILGFSQVLLSNRNKNLTDKELGYATHIMTSGELLLELINDVLDLSKIESGRFEMAESVISVGNAIIESIDQVGSLAAKYNVDVRYEKSDDQPYIRADERALKQVLINLLSNAIKYNNKGGNVRVSNYLDAMQNVCIDVADTGPGIAPEKLELLFQPFNRLGAESTSIEGTGIGLTITERLVTMMDGLITVDSIPGEGSTFHLKFPWAEKPVQAESEEAAMQSVTEALTEDAVPEQKRLLYIEDNKVNLKLVESILGSIQNLELISAPDAETGIEVARSELPDLVLMDINLPGMDGFSALRLLQQTAETRHIPVIALTAKAMAGDADKAREAGFVDYVTKPIDVGIFKDVVRRVLFPENRDETDSDQ